MQPIRQTRSDSPWKRPIAFYWIRESSSAGRFFGAHLSRYTALRLAKYGKLPVVSLL